MAELEAVEPHLRAQQQVPSVMLDAVAGKVEQEQVPRSQMFGQAGGGIQDSVFVGLGSRHVVDFIVKRRPLQEGVKLERVLFGVGQVDDGVILVAIDSDQQCRLFHNLSLFL